MKPNVRLRAYAIKAAPPTSSSSRLRAVAGGAVCVESASSVVTTIDDRATSVFRLRCLYGAAFVDEPVGEPLPQPAQPIHQSPRLTSTGQIGIGARIANELRRNTLL